MAKSSVLMLEPRIKEAVDRAIREERATLDEIVAMIEQMGGEASRSAVGRYAKNAREKLEKFREAQQLASVWIERMEEEPRGEVGQMVGQMLRTVLYQQLATMDGEKAGAMDLHFLARAIKDLASADKTMADRELRIRAETAKAAAAKVDKIAKKGGLTAETVEQLKREILGVAA